MFFLQSPNLSDFAFSVLHFPVCGPLHQDFLFSQLRMTLCSACLWAISQPTYSDLNPDIKYWDHQMSFLHFSQWACLVLSGVFFQSIFLKNRHHKAPSHWLKIAGTGPESGLSFKDWPGACHMLTAQAFELWARCAQLVSWTHGGFRARVEISHVYSAREFWNYRGKVSRKLFQVGHLGKVKAAKKLSIFRCCAVCNFMGGN